MIVRLTKAQHSTCRWKGNNLHKMWLLNTATPAGQTMIDSTMPPIGWLMLRDLLAAEAFTVYGNRVRGSAVCSASLKRIARALAGLEGHPAFKGQLMPGIHTERFVAWGPSPYPIDTLPAQQLLPETITVGHSVMTQWRWSSGCGDFGPFDVFDPAMHLEFMRSTGSPSAEPAR